MMIMFEGVVDGTRALRHECVGGGRINTTMYRDNHVLDRLNLPLAYR